MPFIFDNAQIDRPEDDTEPAPPRLEQFVYIPSPEFGGAREPVRFNLTAPDAPPKPAAPEPPPSHPLAPTEPTQEQMDSILQRLIGLPLSAPASQEIRRSFVEQRDHAKREQAERLQRLLAILVPALRQIGGNRVYGRYDGGNDEGWAWFDSLEVKGGERIDLAAVGQLLHDIQVHTTLRSAGFPLKDRFAMRTGGESSDQGALKSVVNDWLCNEWASMLLGESFGTGNYSMYGAFTVDLETCTITDDPAADPVVEHIRIAR
jgi:hypothetical protein